MRLTRILAVAAAGTLATAMGGIGIATAGDGLNKSGTQLEVDQIGYSKTVQHLSNTPPVGSFVGSTGSDIAFQDDYAFAGNYNGFVIYDISNPKRPKTVAQVSCPGSQNDITVNGNLLYLSTDSSRSDDSCASTSAPATEKSSWEGIKIFDIKDKSAPRYLKAVETRCGSHTHSLLPGKGKNKGNDYLYVSSYSPNSTFPDCQPPHDIISIIQVPTKNPAASKVVATPTLFPDGGNPGGTGPTGAGYSATTGCHDITVYPKKDLAAGACMGDGIIMDVKNPVAPEVIERVTDTENFAFWHSATFNSDATKVVFTDELGGGGAATCNDTVGPTRGANAIYDLSKRNQLTFKSYYKIPRNQFNTENCVAHNGSLVPVKGRDVMVQSWYQGGTSVWDFTDSENPKEIGYFERGPISKERLVGGGTWSSYYYNGHVYSNDLVKGFDVLKLKDRSLRGAEAVTLDQLNPQSQPVYKTR